MTEYLKCKCLLIKINSRSKNNFLWSYADYKFSFYDIRRHGVAGIGSRKRQISMSTGKIGISCKSIFIDAYIGITRKRKIRWYRKLPLCSDLRG